MNTVWVKVCGDEGVGMCVGEGEAMTPNLHQRLPV